MRFIIMHKTTAHWEAGAIPTPELVARVGTLLGELAKAGALQSGEGLRPSSEGVRLTFSGGRRTITEGPFTGRHELPASFSILRVGSLDEAIEWATRAATVLGDVEMDIRPVTEAWDIGMAPRPAQLATRRFMVLRKATAASEAGAPLSPGQQAEMDRLVSDPARAGVHLVTEKMRPSARGRRYKNSRDGLSVMDGPFTESKEMIGGYVIVSLPSLDEADKWARRYIEVVDAGEVDLRELEG
ncbi:MAG: YciI family protein [Vicinamibacterales bacterium]